MVSFVISTDGEKMLQLRQKLMNLMDKQYQGRDGIMDEAHSEKEEKLPRFVKEEFHVRLQSA